MSHAEEYVRDFIGYEYKAVTVNREQVSLCLDCYRNFGWSADENIPVTNGAHEVTIQLKRNRKMVNKMELTRLQRNFEVCISEVKKLEKAKTSAAAVWALAVGILGTVCVAVSTFAVTAEPPRIFLCALFAIPGFSGWILPYFIYKKVVRKQTERLLPMIEEKYDEIYEISEKGSKLIV